MADINDIKVNWRVYISMKIVGNDTKSGELFFFQLHDRSWEHKY